ncbi:hypothetical protein CDAR_242913 [Caerostris darwini]|uniref:RING-type domain-containing protein n=1 Tax=Caerostris darwini TaxID=1538125 RepID=A0AAV4UHM7_9ARAC|nr:hypothetical protein CDAR_242913 [Caerostris darwini]
MKMPNVNEDRDVCNPEEHKEKMSNVNEDRDVCNPEEHKDFVGQFLNSNSLDIKIANVSSLAQFSKKNKIQESSSNGSQLTESSSSPDCLDDTVNGIIKDSSAENAFTEEQSKTQTESLVDCINITDSDSSCDCLDDSKTITYGNIKPQAKEDFVNEIIVETSAENAFTEEQSKTQTVSLVNCINSTESSSSPDCLDDSIIIIYENIKPQTKEDIVNGIVKDGSAENAFTKEQSETQTESLVDCINIPESSSSRDCLDDSKTITCGNINPQTKDDIVNGIIKDGSAENAFTEEQSKTQTESLVDCINITEPSSSRDCVDDSIIIIYENIKPQTKDDIVNRIVKDGPAENVFTEEQSETQTESLVDCINITEPSSSRDCVDDSIIIIYENVKPQTKEDIIKGIVKEVCAAFIEEQSETQTESLVDCINITDSHSSQDCLDDSKTITYGNIKPQTKEDFVNGIIKYSSAENACKSSQSTFKTFDNSSTPLRPNSNAPDDNFCFIKPTTSQEISPYVALPYVELPDEIMNDGYIWPPVFDNKRYLAAIFENNKLQAKEKIITNSSVENAFTEEQFNKKKSKIECGICFESYAEVVSSGGTMMSTVCGHIFCIKCLKIAFETKKACPRCRKKLTVRQVHPIFL